MYLWYCVLMKGLVRLHPKFASWCCVWRSSFDNTPFFMCKLFCKGNLASSKQVWFLTVRLVFSVVWSWFKEDIFSSSAAILSVNQEHWDPVFARLCFHWCKTLTGGAGLFTKKSISTVFLLTLLDPGSLSLKYPGGGRGGWIQPTSITFDREVM